MSRKIKQVSRQELVHHPWGDTKNIIQVVMKVVNDESELREDIYKQLTAFSRDFFAADPREQYEHLHHLWAFVRENITYIPDPNGTQDIKHPARTWEDKAADCKSLTVFIYYVLYNLDIPCIIRFASYNSKKRVQHVYPVAVLNGQEIILDACLDEFDGEEPPTKIVNKKPKSYRTLMTKIREIAGVNRQQSGTMERLKNGAPIDEMRQRALNVPRKQIINYTRMTEGEMSLALLAERINILSGFYPENQDLHQAKAMVMDAMAKGVHGWGVYGNSTGYVSEANYIVAQAIKDAKTMTQPAGMILMDSRVDLRHGIGNPFIDNLDCYSINIRDDNGRIDPQKVKIRDKCLDENRWRELLNDNWEEASAHVMYEFLEASHNPTQKASTKSVLHNIAIDRLNSLSKISRSNIELWTENGILRSTANEGVEPQSGADAIDHLILAKTEGIGCGGLCVAIIGAVVTIITASIQAAKDAKNDMPAQQRADFVAGLNGWGQGGFGANADDWPVLQQTDPTGGTGTGGGVIPPYNPSGGGSTGGNQGGSYGGGIFDNIGAMELGLIGLGIYAVTQK